MRLKRLEIRGFGRLKGRVPLDVGEGRVALVLERNEAGKSTLAAAVLAALYGLEGDGRRYRGTFTEKDRYRPWGGGPYGLSLTLEVGGQELVIDRDLERETVRVLRGAEDVTDRFRQGSRVCVGEILTGLRRQQFLLSCFVGQGDIVWSEAQELTEALQRAADSQEGTATAAQALAALDQALARYEGITLQGPGRVDTEIKRCTEELAARRAELDALESQRHELDASLVRLQDREREEQELQNERDLLRLRRARSEAASLESVLASDDETLARLHELDAALAEDPTLERLRDEDARELEARRREYDGWMGSIQRDRTDLARRRNEIARLRSEREALGVVGTPEEDDVAAALAVRQNLEEFARERARLESELAGEAERMRGFGYDPDTAFALAGDFEALREEDRLLLGGRIQTVARLGERLEEAESQRAQARRDLESIHRAQDRRRHRGWAAVLAALLTAAGTFAFSDRIPVPPWALALLPALLGAVGVSALATAGGLRRREEQDALRRLELAAAQIREVGEERLRADDEWERLALRLGMDSALMEQRYRDWCRLENRVGSVVLLRRRLDEVSEAERRARSQLVALERYVEGPIDPESLEEVVRRLRQAQRLDQRLADLREEADGLEARAAEVGRKLQELDIALRERLQELGVELAEDESLETGFDRFGERRQAASARAEMQQRRRSLAERVLDPESRQAHEQRLQTLRAEIDRLEVPVQEWLRRQDPARLPEVEEALLQGDYERALADVERIRESRREESEQLRIRLRAFLGRYEGEAPPLRERIAALEVALRRAEEFREAVGLARATLEEISRQTHRRWANALNKHTNAILRGLQSHVREVDFDEHLGLRFVQEGQVITGNDATRLLSAGAADALFLAARLAVSRFLTDGGEPLPLVLDDPFANADDSRLLAAFRLLLDGMAPHQQVVLMACQHSRYEWLQSALGRPDRLVVLDVVADDSVSGGHA